MSRRLQTALTVVLTVSVVSAGAGYQFYYNRERARTEKIVTGFYRKYFGREPDPNGLRHWVRWAQDRWGIEKVERLGFIEAAERRDI